jgi:hypothetical protein
MSDHPHVMLSDRALANFSRFIKANPNGPPRNPSGAFDAMPPRLSRHGGIPISAFERGGAYDSAEGQSLSPDTVSKLLDFIKGANFPAGEAEQLYQMIENATGGPDLAADARTRRIATDAIVARGGRQHKRAAELFPELARIRIG